ncbi:MAG TPA: VOC family protein [Acidimicrobiales bacterium]|nr:VOC family protein [Acidimicrobiales bacterium]
MSGDRAAVPPAAAPLTGLSHVQLNVTDPVASAGWYTAALGLEPYAADPAIGYVALIHRPARLVVVLTRRGGGPPDHAAGVLDHLAFAVPDGSSLEAWAAHLTAIGIPHPGVVPENGNPSLQLRDPDGTAVELVAPGP